MKRGDKKCCVHRVAALGGRKSSYDMYTALTSETETKLDGTALIHRQLAVSFLLQKAITLKARIPFSTACMRQIA